MHLVSPNLYLGNRDDARNVESLTSAGVSHILTVDSEELDLGVDSGSFEQKFVRASDEWSTDLLSRFDECSGFIQKGRQEGGVLVHCLQGVSRSAAVVAAHLMQAERWSCDQALQHIRQVKPDVRPNDGFMSQLMLYESMGCRVDQSRVEFKQYRLEHLAQQFHEQGQVESSTFASDPHERPDTSGNVSNTALFRCRKCRRGLFRSDSIMEHETGSGQTCFSWYKRGGAGDGGSSSVQCSSIFVIPVTWMAESLAGVVQGKLLCPKCNGRLGSFNWAGEQCSCGAWITPSIQLHKNRIDEVRNLGPNSPVKVCR
ncbi:DUSP12 [Branchiostoma lanceolatum]|uniref:Dual specificity protein phosphatase 12 n=1 Tax=Branchiostoma lanceolatum TaxID=7740 RepID=A0A8K0ACW6_BRALA|nr:DUSP12 [Branchiostoma lanceolatum]